eukprot:TRINITY_DN2541_c0_g1_i3.p1 TRINITY_DN2541_c0_g1~~TRINITY_DN2541_c0_g1_i3.p1  ORF type:complete len:885 (+),score=181.92 TRINITY_DN2541_c0_g1_i3:3063-5717(+)
MTIIVALVYIFFMYQVRYLLNPDLWSPAGLLHMVVAQSCLFAFLWLFRTRPSLQKHYSSAVFITIALTHSLSPVWLSPLLILNPVRFCLPFWGIMLEISGRVYALTFLISCTPFFFHLDLPVDASSAYEKSFLVQSCLCFTIFAYGLSYMILLRHRHVVVSLEQAAQRASSASVAKQIFLGNMSHELRTPVSNMLGLVHLLQQTEISESQGKIISTLSSTAQAMLSLIGQILDFANLESGNLRLDVAPFDVRATMESVSALFRHSCDEKKLDFCVEVSPTVPVWVNGDKLRVSQILMNFLSNAVKFTESGRIVCSVSIGQTPHTLSFAVSDTGLGIPANKIREILEPFTQADNSHTRKIGGAGLGLTISHRLALLHGGSLRVSSTPKVGSVFTFECEFPAATPAQIEAQMQKKKQEHVGEDCDTCVLLSPPQLRHLGHSIHSFSSSREASSSPSLSPVPESTPAASRSPPVSREVSPSPGSSPSRSPPHAPALAHSEISSSQQTGRPTRSPRTRAPALLRVALAADDSHAQSGPHPHPHPAPHSRSRPHSPLPSPRTQSPSSSPISRLNSFENALLRASPPCLPCELPDEDLPRFVSSIGVGSPAGASAHSSPDTERMPRKGSPAAAEAVDVLRNDAVAQGSSTEAGPLNETHRVLVAEDNRLARMILVRALKQKGYEVVGVEDGVAAVAEVRKTFDNSAENPPFLCVLMDVQMPELDGIDATRQIRQLEATATLHSDQREAVPIYALTANSCDQVRESCLEAGMSKFFSKPVLMPVLFGLLTSLAQKRRGSLSKSGGSTPRSAPTTPKAVLTLGTAKLQSPQASHQPTLAVAAPDLAIFASAESTAEMPETEESVSKAETSKGAETESPSLFRRRYACPAPEQ